MLDKNEFIKVPFKKANPKDETEYIMIAKAHIISVLPSWNGSSNEIRCVGGVCFDTSLTLDELFETLLTVKDLLNE